MVMRKYFRIIAVISGVVLAVVPVWADNGAGTCSFTFLKLGMDARSVALGEAFTAFVDNATATYWNPAGLARVSCNHITGTYLNYIAGIQSGYLGYALPLWENSGLGIGITYFDYGKIQETTPDNPTGQGLGEYGASDFSASLAYAKRLGQFYLGIGLKGIYSKIHDYSAHAIACDLGVQCELFANKLLIGLAGRNLGIQTGAFIEEKANLPLDIEFGLGYRLFDRSLLLALDVGKPMDNRFNFQTGIEYCLKKILLFRLGYRSLGSDLKSDSDLDILAGVSTGIGVRAKNFLIDYAFIPFNELGNTHRISFSMEFGSVRQRSSKKPSVDHYKKAEEYRKNELWAEAAAEYEKVVSSDAGNVMVYSWLGYCYYKLGNKDKAITAYEKALEIDPDNETVKKSLKILKDK